MSLLTTYVIATAICIFCCAIGVVYGIAYERDKRAGDSLKLFQDRASNAIEYLLSRLPRHGEVGVAEVRTMLRTLHRLIDTMPTHWGDPPDE
jgi:hypothetical protein